MAVLKDVPTEKRKSRKIKLSKTGNPTSRPFLSRILGMVTSLVVSLALIAVVVFLRKTLPDGSKSAYDPTLKGVLRRREDEGTSEMKVRQHLGERDPVTIGPVATFKPPIIIDVPSVGSAVECITKIVPGKKAKRQGYAQTDCTTSYFTITSSLTPSPSRTSSPRLTFAPTHITNNILPIMSPVVNCTTIEVAGRMAKRSQQVYCSTDVAVVTTSSSPSLMTPSTSAPSSHPPEPSSADPCMTSSVQCPVVKARDTGYECATSFYTIANCYSSTVTSSPAASTSATSQAAFSFSSIVTSSLTSSSTSDLNNSSSVSIAPTSSTDPCVTMWMECPVIEARNGSDSCSTLISTFTSCLSAPATPSPGIPSNSTSSSRAILTSGSNSSTPGITPTSSSSPPVMSTKLNNVLNANPHPVVTLKQSDPVILHTTLYRFVVARLKPCFVAHIRTGHVFNARLFGTKAVVYIIIYMVTSAVIYAVSSLDFNFIVSRADDLGRIAALGSQLLSHDGGMHHKHD
ncbi:hypothetical protein QBC46DRAFT_358838 [Diplogelasinospora grovesii]|uniref:Uncharacterized protein n=1 Tax=Diplogelasinospora grovesii TaxID=303347 RepID=A0AAN6MXB9_9PEZI|nr:hypothetical protein QBC46DRAFT_358838 [Diplogelasinospora grovesii]